MKKIIYLSTLVSCFSLYSCVPVNTGYERAATLGKGNVDLAGSYSRYTGISEGESESLHSNYGFRAGYGLSDKVDIKLRYENISITGDGEGSLSGNYLSLVPKFSIVKNKSAFLLPISMYSGPNIDNVYSLAPQFIGTTTNSKNTIDFSGSFKGDLLFIRGENGYGKDTEFKFLLGLTVGAGFSQDLNKWAIRPEIGYMIEPGETGGALSYGLGLSFTLPTGKK
jgi:hypothetical protein